jgi:hypothetical protein
MTSKQLRTRVEATKELGQSRGRELCDGDRGHERDEKVEATAVGIESC